MGLKMNKELIKLYVNILRDNCKVIYQSTNHICLNPPHIPENKLYEDKIKTVIRHIVTDVEYRKEVK